MESGRVTKNLENLLEYLNKNIENLKMNLEFKSFGLKQDTLYIKKTLLKEYQKNVSHSRTLENSFQISEASSEEITNKSIIDTLQDLIDNGKIQHAFIIYSAFRNRIKVPEKILKSWNHGYIGKHKARK